MPDTPEPAPRPDHARTAYERYLPWKRTAEIAFWTVGAIVSAVGNSITVAMELTRAGLPFHPAEPAIWEWTSNLTHLAIVPLVVWFTRRFPPRPADWRTVLPLYLAGSVAYCVLHVAVMVGLRNLVYWAGGTDYDFGDWGRQLLYEYVKDVRSFFGMVLTIELYRFGVRRLQGEASLLAAPDDDTPPVEPVERPERFLVRKLGREYPLRSTIAAIEARLDPRRFRRVHRSHIVNLDHVASIEPLDTGDARVHLREGRVVPVSRRYLGVLRESAG